MSVSSAMRALLGVATAALVVAGAGEARPTGTSEQGAAAAHFRVGHSVQQIEVKGTLGETRTVDVHLWYPADQRGLSDAPKTFYRSTLSDEIRFPGIPAQWRPSWKVEAELAREDVPIDPSGKPFPVIVFSHGNQNEPIDYAFTLELIAADGFVVAAPAHANNTQDDVRLDFVNSQPGFKPLPCTGGEQVPHPCSTANIPRSMITRVRDISKILDELPGWYGDRVDMSRVGVLGHSRGTATALTAAGGSVAALPKTECGTAPWNIPAEPRIKAVMGLAIAARPITFCANLAQITVPTLLVAGTGDLTSPQSTSEDAFDQIVSEEKAFVSIENATHRTFDSTYCAQMQASGAIAQANPLAIVDLHTVTAILKDPRGTSGVGLDYCSLDSFTSPVDIRPLAAAITGFNFTTGKVPRTDLTAEEVKQGVHELAVAFFGTVLKRTGNDGPHFTRYLAPKWLEKHVPIVDRAEAFAGEDAVCPPGQEVVCAD